MLPVIFLIVITTTLTNLRTPSPFAIIPDILRAKLISTITQSKKLNLSSKNQKLEAKVFKMISVKKSARKVVSILLKNVSLRKGIRSAMVSQNMMKTV